MGAEVVQFFERRSAVAVRVIRHESAAAPQIGMQAGRRRAAGEGPRDRVGRLFVVLLFFFLLVPVAALGERRFVALRLDTPAELELHPLEVQLLQREESEPTLIDRRRQGFLAGRCIVAVDAPEAEPAAQRTPPALLEHAAVNKLVVAEGRSDLLFAVLEELDFVVLPIDIAQFQDETLDRRAEVVQSPGEAVALAARVEHDPLELFLVLIVVFFFFLFAFFFVFVLVLFAVVAVKFLNERHAVAAVIDFDVEAEKSLVAEAAEAAAAIRAVRPRVGDLALLRSGIVARADARARAPDHPIAGAVLEPGVARGQRVRRARRCGKITAQPLVRVAMNLMVPADGVDRAADGVARVEQRRRTLDDLEPLELRRVDHFAVVARR